MTRTRLTLLSLVALLCCLSLAGSARAATITGIADEDLDHWSPATWSAFKTTGVGQVRHIVPWDTALRDAGDNPVNPDALTEAHNWVNAALLEGIDPKNILISFGIREIAWPPSAEIYAKAVAAFRQEFSQITTYTAWNEPNHSVVKNGISLNPDASPQLAADYWLKLNGICAGACTVIAGDFSDDANIATYMDAYKARLAEKGASPAIWAMHPYSVVASGEWARVLSFMSRSENKPVWFTEVGGYVCKTGSGLVGGSYPAAEANQAQSIKNLRDILDYYGPAKVQRTYYYAFSAPNGTQHPCVPGNYVFDTTLLGANASPRPGFSVAFPGALNPPSVSTGGASAVQMSQATVNASVDPRGFETSYRFEYGTTTGYGSTTASSSAGFNAGAVPGSATITGLQPGTTYHYRVVASNAGGVNSGADQTFRTKEVLEAGRWALGAEGSGAQWLYYANANGYVAQLYWDGGPAWKGGPLGGSIRSGTTPAAVSDPATGMQWVYYVNTAGEIAQWVWTGKEWVHFTLGGSVRAGTSPTVVRDSDGDVQWLYYVDAAGAIKQMAWNGHEWQSFTAGGSVQSGTSPTVVRDPASGVQWLYYTNTSGNVAQLYWDGGPEWKGKPLGGNVRSGTSPTAVFDPVTGRQWVYYINASGEVGQWFWNGAGWLHFNIGGSAQPGTSPTAVRGPSSDQQWLYYTNTSGNVAQLYWDGGPEWKGKPLGGNVRSGTSPVALYDKGSGAQRVYYLNSTGGLSQWVWNGVEWLHFVIA
jgi:hypothetical protein